MFFNVDILVNIFIIGDIINVFIFVIMLFRIDVSGSVDIGIFSGIVLVLVGLIILYGGDVLVLLDIFIEIDFGFLLVINFNIGKFDGFIVINIVGGVGVGLISILIIDLWLVFGFFNVIIGLLLGFFNWGVGSVLGLLNFGNNLGFYNFVISSMGNLGF